MQQGWHTFQKIVKLMHLYKNESKGKNMIEVTSMRNYLKELQDRLKEIWGYL